MQENSAFIHVEFHEAPVIPFLPPVQVPRIGSTTHEFPSIWCLYKLGDSALQCHAVA